MQELDSIVARALRVAEFFDSIGQKPTQTLCLLHERWTAGTRPAMTV
jgi:hypothetical protein